MGQIIIVASHKGGVGKTTTALNFAYSLSRLGGKVLLLDLDPQGGATVATNVRKKTDKGLFDYLSGDGTLKEAVCFSKEKKLAVMGIGNINPEGVLKLESWAQRGGLDKVLRYLSGYFDYLVVDAPAGLGALPAALLRSGDHILLPVQCRSLALKTLPMMLATIRGIRETSRPDLELGVLLTMYSATNKIEKQLLAEVREGFPERLFYKTVIAYHTAYEEAGLQAIPVSMLSTGQEPAMDYMSLAIEFKQRELSANVVKGENNDSDSGLF